jgi:small GTP-binding protein
MSKRKLKLVMLGEGRVGKTSMLNRFQNDTFDEQSPSTTKASMYAAIKIEVGGRLHDVAVWDTAGQEKFHALGPIYYRDAHGAVLVYDITDQESFAKVKVWLKELHQVVGEDIQVCVIGNKIDLERQRKVKASEAEQWCSDNGALHYLCSAKLALNTSAPFNGLVTRIVESGGRGRDDDRGAGGGMGAAAPARARGVRISADDDLDAARDKDKKCPC